MDREYRPDHVGYALRVNIAQSLENLKLEQDAIALYDALASIDKDPRRQAAFRHIATNERRHAEIWATRLRELGATVPPAARPRARVRFIILAARVLGTKAVAELVQSLEGDEVDLYEDQEANPEIDGIAADEREHAEIWKRLDRGEGHEAESAHRVVPATAAATEVVTATEHPPAPDATRSAPDQITRREGWHRSARSGTLRAIIFGVSDGLVSNLSLVMGVAGASGQDQFILLAGIAGLLAGAFSMAAGEYISMQSQRELFERQIELERAELEAMPDDEQRELVAIYVGKGIPRDEAEQLAARMFEDRGVALDTLVREELGLDPDELGSPWGAATGSFLAFAAGAAVPVVPYLFAAGTAAFAASLGLSLLALFAVGAGVSLLTGRGLLFSGLRQVGIGAAAAGVTYIVGRIIGVGVAG
jgi:VIT1/CCC1 family predicted Fe2+/Mn2+ transporter/rubrerythrin